jgi:hypothetical protein
MLMQRLRWLLTWQRKQTPRSEEASASAVSPSHKPRLAGLKRAEPRAPFVRLPRGHGEKSWSEEKHRAARF